MYKRQEFIRCSTKYPNILVDLVSGDELQDRLIAHRLGVVESANGLQIGRAHV